MRNRSASVFEMQGGVCRSKGVSIGMPVKSSGVPPSWDDGASVVADLPLLPRNAGRGQGERSLYRCRVADEQQ